MEWVFRNINHEFTAAHPCVILGNNGSGKSTLLQLMAGYIAASNGKLEYNHNGKSIESDSIFSYLSIAAPYLETIEDMTLTESILFHSRFKPFVTGVSLPEVASLINLPYTDNKPLRYFSSGMKQRVRLGLAILSNTPLLLLDEPCTNLDQHSIEWYHHLVKRFGQDRIIVVCSNHREEEYRFCTQKLEIHQYK